MDRELRDTIKALIRHTTGRELFDEDAFYATLEEKVIEYDWQKRLCRLLARLDAAVNRT